MPFWSAAIYRRFRPAAQRLFLVFPIRPDGPAMAANSSEVQEKACFGREWRRRRIPNTDLTAKRRRTLRKELCDLCVFAESSPGCSELDTGSKRK
jgi:hypothetical protein